MHTTELTIQLPHLRLAAKAWGNPTHRRVLALHGWLDNAASFDRLAPLLSDCYVVALDLPGHGLSDHRPLGTWYHYVDYLDDVLDAVSAMDWSNFTLLGHSLGGAVASVFAAAYPSRIDWLLLIEALGPLSGDPDQTLPQLRRSLDQRAQMSNKALRVFANIEQAVEARAQANELSRAAAEALVSRGLKAVAGGYSWSSDPRLTLLSPSRHTEAQVLDLMRGIKTPTLLVLAEPAAPFVSAELMQTRIAAVAGLQLLRIQGNHHLHLEQPQPVANAMNRFMRGSIGAAH